MTRRQPPINQTYLGMGFVRNIVAIVAVLALAVGIGMGFAGARFGMAVTPPVAGVPASATPLELNLGTPVPYGVSGPLKTVLQAGQTSLRVDGVTVAAPGNGGYCDVAVTLTVHNGSVTDVLGGNSFVLVDNASNIYAQWGVPSADGSVFQDIAPGNSGQGVLGYRVPVPALANKLRLRLDVPSVALDKAFRMEVMLGDLRAP